MIYIRAASSIRVIFW